jgi:hypothetical protein
VLAHDRSIVPMCSPGREVLSPSTGGTFRHRVELAHGIGDAGFFERPARAEVADLALGKGGTQLNALTRTGALGSTDRPGTGSASR